MLGKGFTRVVLCFALIALLSAGAALAATEETKQTSIDNGLAWLAATQTVAGAEGYWPYANDGTLAATASAALAFIEEGYLPGDLSMYDAVVTRAVNYIFNRATVDGRFGVELAGYPRYAEDYNNDGIYDDGNDEAIFFEPGVAPRRVYTSGIVAPVVYALGEALGKDTVVGIGSAAISGKTYAQAMQDIVDWFSWAQIEPNRGNYRGGWRYDANWTDSDNSTAQWGSLPLLYAADWGLGVSSFVFHELNMWVNYIQNANGGSGYEHPSSIVNVAKTGGLLLELAAVGADVADARVVGAVGFIDSKWNTGPSGTWYGNLNHPYAMWAVYKGLQVYGYLVDFDCSPGTIMAGQGIPNAPGGYTICSDLNPSVSSVGDWYSHYCDYLVGIQNGDGSWSGYSYWNGALATGWYINILNAVSVPPPNEPPVAVCQDVVVEADEDCEAEASVDGGSYDPDDDDIALEQVPPGPYLLGDTHVTLIVTDEHGDVDTCTATVTVVDVTPPEIAVSLNRDVLWPPNHKMVDIWVEVAVHDNCDMSPDWTLVSITSNEPDNGQGDGNTVNDIQGANFGEADAHFQLRSERQGGGDGRKYTIVYRVVDDSGNATEISVCVRVPHDMSGHAMASLGFASDGLTIDESFDRFALVIPSRPDKFAMDINGNLLLIEKGFDATTIDPQHVYVGNTKGVVRPSEVVEIDVNGNGLKDLGLYYSTEAVLAIQSQLTAEEKNEARVRKTASHGPIGIHYRGGDGIDYLVTNLFGLGEPVPLLPTLPPIVFSDGDAPGVTKATEISSIYPNPFNPTTTVEFTLKETSGVMLRIYDARGALVRTLKNETLPAGVHQVQWNGRDEHDRQVATGVYFAQLTAGQVRSTKKLVMIK